MDLGSRISRDGAQAPSSTTAFATGLRSRFPFDCPGTYMLWGHAANGGLLADMEVMVTVKPVAS